MLRRSGRNVLRPNEEGVDGRMLNALVTCGMVDSSWLVDMTPVRPICSSEMLVTLVPTGATPLTSVPVIVTSSSCSSLDAFWPLAAGSQLATSKAASSRRLNVCRGLPEWSGIVIAVPPSRSSKPYGKNPVNAVPTARY
jgi:hypothetical protein